MKHNRQINLKDSPGSPQSVFWSNRVRFWFLCRQTALRLRQEVVEFSDSNSTAIAYFPHFQVVKSPLSTFIFGHITLRLRQFFRQLCLRQPGALSHLSDRLLKCYLPPPPEAVRHFEWSLLDKWLLLLDKYSIYVIVLKYPILRNFYRAKWSNPICFLHRDPNGHGVPTRPFDRTLSLNFENARSGIARYTEFDAELDVQEPSYTKRFIW